MELDQRIHQITKLRAEFRRNGRLRLEYLASMSRLFREHGIDIGDDSLANMVPADIGELSAEAPHAPGAPKPAPHAPGGPRPAPHK